MDSSCITYGDCLNPNYSWYVGQVAMSTIFTEDEYPGDPDLTGIEQDFEYCYGHNHGYRKNPVGLGDWAATWNLYGCFRRKIVATFDSIPFDNSEKVSDTDIYLEYFSQYLAADTNRNYLLDPAEEALWDWDQDSVPPIDTSGNTYVYDEDDWDTLYHLGNDPEHGYPQDYGFLKFDKFFDGKPDFGWQVTESEYENPPVHGTDTDNDGLLIGIDINRDGDKLDSVGVNESGCLGIDNNVAMFLDSLEYNHATFIILNCFGGGYINDLSRSNVLVATATTEGTISWGTWFTGYMADALTGGITPDSPYVVTFQQAFNYVADFGDGRERLDDNGDRVGHGYELPSGGDGYLADSIAWGTLPLPAPPPVLLWPDSGDTIIEDIWCTFVWRDTGEVDSFDMWWAAWPGCDKVLPGIEDTTYTLTGCNHLKPMPRDSLWWTARSYKGLARSDWVDWSPFSLEPDTTCCVGMRGNVDGDTLDVVDVGDLTKLTQHLFTVPCCPLPCMMEANCDGIDSDYGEIPDIGDQTKLIDHLYISLDPLPDCSD